MPLTVSVLSWNVHKCVGGLDRRYDPGRIAAVIAAAKPDVVLLQEVAQNGLLYRHDRQVDVLGDALGMPHRSYFVNVRFGKHRGEYGNAILSNAPIACTENVDLTIAGRKARSGLHAELRLPTSDGGTRTLHIFNLHLGLGERERREQLLRLLGSKTFGAIHATTPILVAGDFNDLWGTIGKRYLVTAGFLGPLRPLWTFPAWAPVRALDSLYVRGDVQLSELTRLRSAATRVASDHLPLFAQLRVLPPKPA